MKVKRDKETDGYYHHWCPGCKARHLIPDWGEPGKRWTFNNNFEKPSFQPSVRLSAGGEVYCHYFITDGNILFCEDSAHALAGKAVPLPDLPKEFQ